MTVQCSDCEIASFFLFFRGTYLYTGLGLKAYDVEFITIENTFYATMFVAGGVGHLARNLRSEERYSLSTWIGSCVAAGCCGGGGVAFWVARNSGSSGSSWLFLFASFAIGYMFREFEGVIIKGAIKKFLSMLGMKEDEKN